VLVLLGIAFLAGLITATSPCVLPVLPILVADGASSTDRRRPFAIVAGIVVSFTVFTLLGATLLSALGLPQDLLRNLALAALLLFAASLLSRRVAWILERPFLFLTRRRVARDSNGVVIGLSVGLVFVPCAGPVLAAMTALAASNDISARIVLVTAAYALGAALPMLAIAAGSQRLASGLHVVRRHARTMRGIAGAVVAVTALAIAFGADQQFTTAIPGYTAALQDRIERSSTAERELARLTGIRGRPEPAEEGNGPRAPEFRGIELWLNTPDGEPISLRRLRGKVVLVDFWTYSCINCLRTLPHLEAWDRAYRAEGLTIVGVHSPEFAFERVPDNVRSAVRRLGLRYPVALDNDFATWNAYANRYWPAKYLIDKTGRVRFHHFGEGQYDEMEAWIRRLLGESDRPSSAPVADRTPTELTTPESYLGYERLDRFANGRLAPGLETTYRFPESRLPPHHLAYDGRWTVEPERIVAGRGARLRLSFQARDIFLVLAGEGRVEARVDGRALRPLRVSGTPRLYTVARFRDRSKAQVELLFSPGLAAYAFTFG
jgi:cytochrome c biogenesis protein CcdA/thiol-disulfide isomerase/thioredoxin